MKFKHFLQDVWDWLCEINWNKIIFVFAVLLFIVMFALILRTTYRHFKESDKANNVTQQALEEATQFADNSKIPASVVKYKLLVGYTDLDVVEVTTSHNDRIIIFYNTYQGTLTAVPLTVSTVNPEPNRKPPQ